MKHLILLSLFMCLAICGFAQNNPPPVAQEGKPPTIEDLKVAGPYQGLGNRLTLIKYISSSDSDFVFKRRDDVDGNPNYYASDRYSTSVELVGNDDEIMMAKWTFNFVPDKNVDFKEIERMSYFAKIIGGKDGFDWLSNIYLT